MFGNSISAAFRANFAPIEEVFTRLARRQAREHPKEGVTPEGRLSRSESAENADEEWYKICRKDVESELSNTPVLYRHTFLDINTRNVYIC